MLNLGHVTAPPERFAPIFYPIAIINWRRLTAVVFSGLHLHLFSSASNVCNLNSIVMSLLQHHFIIASVLPIPSQQELSVLHDSPPPSLRTTLYLVYVDGQILPRLVWLLAPLQISRRCLLSLLHRIREQMSYPTTVSCLSILELHLCQQRSWAPWLQ